MFKQTRSCAPSHPLCQEKDLRLFLSLCSAWHLRCCSRASVTASPHTGHRRRYKNTASCQLGQSSPRETRVSANERREGGSVFDYRSCVNERCAIRKEGGYLSWQGEMHVFTHHTHTLSDPFRYWAWTPPSHTSKAKHWAWGRLGLHTHTHKAQQTPHLVTPHPLLLPGGPLASTYSLSFTCPLSSKDRARLGGVAVEAITKSL